MRFTFVCEYNLNGRLHMDSPFDVRIEKTVVGAESLDILLPELSDFLRGCGFQFSGDLIPEGE